MDPFSFEELWLPSDLPAPVMKPSLAAVARNGQIRYIMPSLDLTVQKAGKLWWNRGFNSIPLAGRELPSTPSSRCSSAFIQQTCSHHT